MIGLTSPTLVVATNRKDNLPARMLQEVVRRLDEILEYLGVVFSLWSTGRRSRCCICLFVGVWAVSEAQRL
jgi:hypothetical protein